MADFSRITERVFCGAQINSADDMNAIVAAGVTLIIDAQIERSDGALIPAGVSYVWAPTDDDGKHKDANWFKNPVWIAIEALSEPGAIVLTHCAAGVNRGPSLAYAVLRAQGWSRDEAFNQLKAKRPQVNVAYRDDADTALKELGWVK